MKKALIKENFIQIKKTYKRFLSILLMALLGVGFFCGLKAASPDMKITVDDYFDKQNVFDLQIVSTLGLSEKNIQDIKNNENVDKIIPSYSFDALIAIDDMESVVKVHTLTDEINKVLLVDGKMPENADECLVEENFLTWSGHKIGDTVEIQQDNEDIKLTTNKMRIVGTIKSPLYLSNERGTSKLGSGKIDYYMYVMQDAIDSEVYTEAFVILKNAKQEMCFDKSYDDIIENAKDSFENLSETLEENRYQEILKEATDKINDAQNTLDEEKAKAEKEIADAEKKIQNGKSEIRKSENELSQNKIKADNEFKDAQNKIDNAKIELADKEKLFNDSLPQAEQGIKDGKEALVTLNANLQNVEKQIQDIEELLKLQDTQQLREQLAMLQATKATLETNISKVETEIQVAKTQIESTKQLIENGKREIEQNQITLDENKKSTYQKLEDGRIEINKAKNELEEAEITLNEEKQEAQEKIQEAQDEITQAKNELEDLKRPEVYVLDRDTNIGYISYTQDTDRIANIAKVFPLVFFLIAILISLTSMTRMVEEQRVQIGTLKALGYSKIDIASKYITYSLLASVFGSIIGMLIGFYFLPQVVLNMYSMVYDFPYTVVEFNLYYAVIGLLTISLCIGGATIFSCLNELKATPASLMRPKSPKAGKRVLLERVPFIWEKLKFTQKVTVRNIFRYKKRFLMTIVGICGCTALILAGFGLRDSISGIIPNQYEKIYKYQVETTLKDTLTLSQKDKQYERIQNTEHIQNSIKLNMQSATVNDKEDLQIVVVFDQEHINDFITLKHINTEEIYELKPNEIIITQKLAQLIDVKQGDMIKLKNSDDIEVEVKIDKITEHYIQHYIYMADELYQTLYNEPIEYNVILSKLEGEITEQQENALAKQILSDDDVSNVTIITTLKSTFDETMQNFNLVVWILIISAGLLAFVVLYNLSNVNISERIRELATIKVLGFNDKEVYDYVSRETIILTIIGILLGFVLGYYLNIFIIKTCELDMFMFGKDVKALSFVYSAAITAGFTIIVNIVTYFSLKKIDMIESLKSVE